MSEEKTEQRVNISEIMSIISGGSESSDAEMLNIATNYALNLKQRQIKEIVMLRGMALDYGYLNNQMPVVVETFLKDYIDLKHFHESGPYIQGVLREISLYKLWSSESGKVNVMK